MPMYDHPYRLDTVFVQYLFERLHGVSSTSQNPIPADPDATPVCLVSVEELTTLINVAFWASFKKEEGRSVTIAVQGSVSKVEMMTPMALIYKALFSSISTFETPPLFEEGDASGLGIFSSTPGVHHGRFQCARPVARLPA